MRQAYRILPVYTGDVSGVCSALYELGGMVVMHDPSGCNSTYNTHDETRWYDHDSLIFISGLSEPDAIMGNDRKLIRDVTEAAETFHPKFIALCNSPVPYMNGTDFAGISEIIHARTGIRTFYIQTNGMHDYVSGAGLAFEAVARELVEENGTAPVKKDAVNVLGLTPLDFAAEGESEALAGILNEAGWRVNSCWSMGRYVENIPYAGRAGLNLVVSSTGLRAAKVLRERFGTPWVAGVPTGSFRETLFSEMKEAVFTNRCIVAYDTIEQAESETGEKGYAKPAKTAVIIGEPVFCCSMAAGMQEKVTVICSTEGGCELLRTRRRETYRNAGTSNGADGNVCGNDLICIGEEEIENALSGLRPDRIIADPMYKLILPQDYKGEFTEMPHLAFSGRIWLKEMKSRLN